MTRYEIIIYWSKDDNAYIAEVPELAGCMADGASYKEALENVEADCQIIRPDDP
jgi:predicted RNase H-like HicB family nuclease